MTLTVAVNREEGESNEAFAPTSQAPRVQPAPPPPQAPASPVAQQATAPTPEAIPEPTVRSANKPVQEAPTKVDLGDPSLDDLLGEWG